MRSRRRSFDELELLADLRVLADQLTCIRDGLVVLRERDEAEPLADLVRYPAVAVGYVRQLRAQLVERRLRVRQVPENEPDGHSSGTPGVGSRAIRSLTRRSTSLSSCPKSSR